jgi:hypothetical protein
VGTLRVRVTNGSEGWGHGEASLGEYDDGIVNLRKPSVTGIPDTPFV